MPYLQLDQYTDVALLLLRMMVAAIFINSGVTHLLHSEERAKSIGMSKSFILFLGTAETTGGLGVVTGVLIEFAAIGLSLIMLGAICKKIFAWHTGFWGEKGSGWHYDLMIVLMNFVILTTGGGRFVMRL